MTPKPAHPPLPAEDTLVGPVEGRWASYGPRVDHGEDVSVPDRPEDAHYWGVYLWGGETWSWEADVPSRAHAHRLANLLLTADPVE